MGAKTKNLFLARDLFNLMECLFNPKVAWSMGIKHHYLPLQQLELVLRVVWLRSSSPHLGTSFTTLCLYFLHRCNADCVLDTLSIAISFLGNSFSFHNLDHLDFDTLINSGHGDQDLLMLDSP